MAARRQPSSQRACAQHDNVDSVKHHNIENNSDAARRLFRIKPTNIIMAEQQQATMVA